MRGIDIADRIGVLKPAVLVNFNYLIEEGYIVINDYYEIFLIDEGLIFRLSIIDRTHTFRSL